MSTLDCIYSVYCYSFEDKDISDCSELTDTQIEKLRPFYEKHPEWYKVVVAKTPIQIHIDYDILGVLKADDHSLSDKNKRHSPSGCVRLKTSSDRYTYHIGKRKKV